MNFETQIQEELDILTQELLNEENDLILYNDDYNTFDHVIDVLVKYCDHNSIQAEQCAWIVHHNGKCQVKRGAFEKLQPVCEAILESGLTAKIE